MVARSFLIVAPVALITGIIYFPRIYDSMVARDGQYSEWSSWSLCMKYCGPSWQGRYRNCTRKHTGSGKSCKSIGSRVEIKKCILRECPVDGQPGQWQQWSECEIDCQDSTRVRFRKCDKPSPKHFGFQCFDKMKETEQCPSTKPCPIDSKFSEWSSWGECSVTCGAGIKKRTQPCIESEYGGKPCPEKEKIETKVCETNIECPVILNEISTDIISINETQAVVDNKQGESPAQ